MTAEFNWDHRLYKFIQRGEWDLVNVSLIGYDPKTRQTYEERQKEYDEALAALVELDKELKWWQIKKRYRLRLATAALASHQGFFG